MLWGIMFIPPTGMLKLLLENNLNIKRKYFRGTSKFVLIKTPWKKDYAKVKGEEKIYTKYNNEDYFDKFRKKDKLKTKAERILEKDDKN